MARLQGRVLQGSDLRDLNNSLRAGGLKRELYRSIQRGDSPTAIAKIFQNGGWNVSRMGIADYISQNYSAATSIRYFDKIVARYGSRSLINFATLSAAGYEARIRVTIRGLDKRGNSVYRTVYVEGTGKTTFRDAIQDMLEDVKTLDSDSDFPTSQIEVMGYSLAG